MTTPDKNIDTIQAEDARTSIDNEKHGIETKDDIIVNQIETAGEEVGLTWRTALAAFVSRQLITTFRRQV